MSLRKLSSLAAIFAVSGFAFNANAQVVQSEVYYEYGSGTACAPLAGGYAACLGVATNGIGFQAYSSGDDAIDAWTPRYGVAATSSDTTGTYAAIYARADNGFAGITAKSNSGFGVYAQSSQSDAIHALAQATSGASNGVAGTSYAPHGSGVYGDTYGGGNGVFGDVEPFNTGGPGIAIFGNNPSTNASAWAGWFSGKVAITTGLVVAGTCIAGSCSSDLRLKKNIQPLAHSLDDLVKLRPVTFEWKDPKRTEVSPGTQLGFIAQEVETVKPGWVSTDEQGFKTVNMNGLPVMLVDAVRTLKAENDQLRARVDALEAGHRPKLAGMLDLGEGGMGFGLLAVAGAVIGTRRKRAEGPSTKDGESSL